MARLANARTSHMTRWVIPVAKRLLIEEACKNAPTLPLGEVAHIEMGQSPDGDSCNDDGDGIPLIGGPADLGLEFPQSTRWTNSPTKLCKPGDIVVCVRATIGEPRWADGIYCLGRGVAGIRPVDNYLLPRFLFFIIEGNEQILQNQGTGTTFKTISKQHLASIQVPMIPVEEQEIIVSFLLWLEQNSNSRPNFLEAPSLPASLTNQLGIIARIEELAARIEEARGLRRDATEESEKLLDAELDRVFATIAEKFDITVIGQAGGFVTSGPRGWGNFYHENGDRRLIRVENVINRELDLSTAAKVAVPPYEGDIERSQVQVGDVLVTITGAIGRVGVVRNFDMPCHVSQHVALVRVPSTISPYYLYWYLKAPTFGRSQTEGKTYGATKPGINLTNLRMLQIATPPIEQQRPIVAYFDELEAKVDSLKQLQYETSAELDALLPSILDKAFKGEL